MARPPRLHAPGAMYHVTLRGNHRQNIFFTPRDRDVLSELFAEVMERFGARLHAYCYMTNHVHALIQVSDAPLGRLMLRIAGRYARLTQSRLHTTGHLFEKRYYPVLVDADEYLLELLRYIHLNPVRARMVSSPDDYPWSSHSVYLGLRHEPWVTTQFALSMFSTDRDAAVEAYRRFVKEDVSSPSRTSPLVQRNPNDKRIMGSDDFAARVLGAAWRPRSRRTLDELIDEACARFSVSTFDLSSPKRRRDLVIARAWVGRQAIAGRIASLSAVARKLNRDESSLRHALSTYFPEGQSLSGDRS
jgi:putative transposase